MPHTPPTLRVLLVDDQPLFRKALAGLINAQLDMTVVGEADNGLDALERVRTHDPRHRRDGREHARSPAASRASARSGRPATRRRS